MKSQFDNRKAFIQSFYTIPPAGRQVVTVYYQRIKGRIDVLACDLQFKPVILALLRGRRTLSKVHLACLIYFKNLIEVGVRQHPSCAFLHPMLCFHMLNIQDLNPFPPVPCMGSLSLPFFLCGGLYLNFHTSIHLEFLGRLLGCKLICKVTHCFSSYELLNNSWTRNDRSGYKLELTSCYFRVLSNDFYFGGNGFRDNQAFNLDHLIF